MSGGQVFVLLIIAMVMIASVVKARGSGGRRRDSEVATLRDGEAERLRDEVRQLKERIQVLERITVDKENSLERQIEDLRDRP